MRPMLTKTANKVKSHSPIVLSGTAIFGVFTTAYLAARAGYKTAKILASEDQPTELSRKEAFKLVWKEYIPAAGSATVTTACIIGSQRVSGKRTAAAQAAFVITERAYSEYRDMVADEYGESKERRIRDQIAAKTVEKNPPTEVIMTGDGEQLCCELMTKRYFQSDMEKLRRSQNILNGDLLKCDQQTLEDWYDLIGLSNTSVSANLGWTSDKQMELRFTSVLTESGRPCLAFDYNYIKPLHGDIIE